MFGGKKSGVGLDIGTNSIKIVELSNIGKKPSLVKFGIKELPPDVIVDSHIMDPLLITETAQSLLVEAGITTKKVNLGLQGRSVMVKKITTDLMSDNEYNHQVRFDAQNNFPFDFEDIDISLDYHLLDKNKQEKTMEVLLLAAKTDVIDQQLDPITETGLKVNLVDFNLFALQNSYDKTVGIPEDEFIIFVHIGADWLLLNYVSNGNPVLSRDFPGTGTYQIIHQMVRKLGISEVDAKKILKGETPPPPDQTVVVTQIYNELIEEICSNVSKLEDTAVRSKADKIIISGGGVLIPRIKQVMEETLKRPVEVFNPFSYIQVPEEHSSTLNKIGPVLAIAVGLALRG